MSDVPTLTIKGIEFSLVLPDELIEALEQTFKEGELVEIDAWKSKGIVQSLRYLIPKPDVPASYSQINYAESISEALGLDLPEDIEKSWVCSKFISANVADFQEQLEQKKALKYLVKKAVRTHRLLIARKLIDAGENEEAVAKEMKVTSSTIVSYLGELLTWEKMASETEEYKIVIRLVDEMESGIDLHEKYVPYRA